MGVDLSSLLDKQAIQIEDLAGRRVAIDAYNTLYQFLATIRQPDGTALSDASGRITSHLSGLFSRTAFLVEQGVRPVYVFDGAPHELKRATLARRREIKEQAQRDYEKALAAGDLERARSKAQQTSRLDAPMVEQAKALLDALGVPWVQAPSEGEAQASAMVRAGAADEVCSQDYDSLLFGAPSLVRNLSVGGRRKQAGRQAWTDVPIERLNLETTLSALDLSRQQLVDVALMVGTDYNHGVPGIGAKTALKLVAQEGDIEAVISRADKEEKGAMWAKVREGSDGLEPLALLRQIFLEPEVDAVPEPEWSRPDPPAVLALLVDDFGFGRDRVTATLERYQGAAGHRAQATLGDF